MSVHLLTPLSFAGLDLRNRIAMPPMWSGQAEVDGQVTPSIVEYHRVRAAAGCGLVIVEHSFVHPLGRHTDAQIGIHSDDMIPGLTTLARAIKGAGTIACIQISHAGSRCGAEIIGRPPLAPSAIRHPYEPHGEMPEAMTEARIREVIVAFGAAAHRAEQAGFHAVEFHAAHGFLLSQFLSPLTNVRDDAYGGTEENRLRLHLEILAEMKRTTGGRLPIFVRLGAHDDTPGGLDIATSTRAAAALEAAGVALIDVSGGLCGSRPAGKGPGYFVPYAQAVKSKVTCPVLVAGGIADPDHADRLIREGRADLVGVGRAMLNEPLWAHRAITALSGI